MLSSFEQWFREIEQQAIEEKRVTAATLHGDERRWK